MVSRGVPIQVSVRDLFLEFFEVESIRNKKADLCSSMKVNGGMSVVRSLLVSDTHRPEVIT